jgi:hypothetical protein
MRPAARALLVRSRRVPAIHARCKQSESGQQSTPPPPSGEHDDAFKKGAFGMLFGANASLVTLVSALALLMGWQAYTDFAAHDADRNDTIPPNEVPVRELPDGRMLMPDGSIRRRA